MLTSLTAEYRLHARFQPFSCCPPPTRSFCAMKLAEGAIGDVNALPEGTLPAGGLPHTHPLRVVAIDSNPEASTSFAQGPGQGSGGLREAGSSGGAGAGGGGKGDDPGESLSRESSGDVGVALEAGASPGVGGAGAGGGVGGGGVNGGGAGAEAHSAVQRRVNQLVTANSFGAVSGVGGGVGRDVGDFVGGGEYRGREGTGSADGSCRRLESGKGIVSATH